MGAEVFKNRVARSSVRSMAEAFRLETLRARHEYGHGGYTGTVADKWEVKQAPDARPCSTFDEAEREADRLMESRALVHLCYSDKWAACWAIEVLGEEGGWLLFGVSPS